MFLLPALARALARSPATDGLRPRVETTLAGRLRQHERPAGKGRGTGTKRNVFLRNLLTRFQQTLDPFLQPDVLGIELERQTEKTFALFLLLLRTVLK